MDDLLQLLGACFLFGWIPITVYWKNKIRFEEVRAQNRGQHGNSDDVATLHALRELRQEVQALRDTTTKFDMAFDASLDRLEARVERVETRTTASGTTDEAATVLAARR